MVEWAIPHRYCKLLSNQRAGERCGVMGLNEERLDSLNFLKQLDEHGVTGFERYKRWKRFLARKAWETGTPISGQFELTPLCNLDCKMCYVHLDKAQLRGEKLLRAESWLRLMDEAADAGMLSASLTGGECLTHPDFKQIYLHLKRKGIEVTVLTNGTLLNDEMADFFAEHMPRMIQISLYGSNEDAYERVTGHRLFKQTVDAIERVKARSIPLHIALTPSKYMLSDMEALVKLAKRLWHDYHVNSGLWPAREGTGRQMEDFALTAREQVWCMKLRAIEEGMTLYPERETCDLITGKDMAKTVVGGGYKPNIRSRNGKRTRESAGFGRCTKAVARMRFAQRTGGRGTGTRHNMRLGQVFVRY